MALHFHPWHYTTTRGITPPPSLEHISPGVEWSPGAAARETDDVKELHVLWPGSPFVPVNSETVGARHKNALVFPHELDRSISD